MPTPPTLDESDDIRTLHKFGYAQELARVLGGFSNFAISFAIIGILLGGVTSFHVGFCSVGGASIGLGWPLVCLFSLCVAATMGQIASAFPTAGGLYHWAAILGGRGWGWVTAWFNLAGLATLLAAVNVGTFQFAFGVIYPEIEPDKTTQFIAVVLITASQAAFNHLGIRVTRVLTDFSGYLILFVSITLIIALLKVTPELDFSRLWTFSNFSCLPE
jgi:amino acid transporter